MNRFLVAALTLWAAPAFAQVPNLPPNTVLGRTGISAGPAQAIPLTTLQSLLTLTTPLPSGQILIGSAANLSTPQAISGDCTIIPAGVITCPKPAVNLAAGNVNGGVVNILPGGNGGTNNAFFQVSGPATSLKTFTFPNSSQTIAALDLADQTLTGGANVTALAQSTGNVSVDCGARPIQTITNGGAFTVTAPSSDGFCLLKITNNASAGALTFSGFQVGSNTGDTLDTTNAHKFVISIIRAGGDSTYSVKAYQ